MRKLAFDAVIISLFFSLCFSPLTQAQDPGHADTVRVSSVRADSGTTKAVVPVYFYNDEELIAISIPLKWNSAEATLDSVSFVGSRVDYINIKVIDIDNVSRTVLIGCVVFIEPNIQPGNGLACQLYFNIPSGLGDYETIVIDSTFIPPAGNLIFVTSIGLDFVPLFKSGMLMEVEDFHQLSSLPNKFSLAQNYPNPFNATTTIEFSMSVASRAEVKIYDLLGREIETLLDKSLEPGLYRFSWNAESLPSGIYFCRMVTSEGVLTTKMILLK